MRKEPSRRTGRVWGEAFAGTGMPAARPWGVRRRALRPRHILFLCVANSARSQMAEGIARSLAPKRVRVSSAGSAPSSVRPQAVQVLGEIGIDISGHKSKGLDAVDASSVDAVITLCAEEVCPAFLGKSHRIHWGLPDPAAVTGTEEIRLAAFRKVRDELVRRLTVLFEFEGMGERNRKYRTAGFLVGATRP